MCTASRFNRIVKPRAIVARDANSTIAVLAQAMVGADLEKGRCKRRQRHEQWLRHERGVA